MKMAKKTKKKVKGKFRARMILFVPVCLSLVCFLGIMIGKYWIDIVSKYKENEELKEELVSLQEKEEKLAVDVVKLQDPEYIARYAREKFFYSKEGEITLNLPE